MRAILIDDEISNLENLQTLLKKHCPQVIILATAQNVSDAVEAIEKYLPDLVFLDIQMGEQTGFDVLKLLPKRNFEVIFCYRIRSIWDTGCKICRLRLSFKTH